MRWQPSTVAVIAQTLQPDLPLTPREIQHRLPFDFARSTVRDVLHYLVSEGRAMAEGDVFQKRYRLAGDRP